MDGDGEELTAQETALYDRQIRVWGADAQRRLSKSHVLVYGMKGTVAEFCKNIVLAGVGSLTLVDDRVATEEVLSSNFLIPPDENAYSGKTLGELCCNSLKDFNPMVRVSIEKGFCFELVPLFVWFLLLHCFHVVLDIMFCGWSFLLFVFASGDLSSFDVEFFSKFDVVVVSCCSLSAKKLANDKCRKLSKRVAFYAVDCRDSCGEIFVDLQDYKYSKKKQDETVKCDLKYPSFEDALSVPWRALHRRMSKLYYAMRVIEKFEEAEGRSAGEVSIADLSGVLKLKKEICTAQSLNESHVPDTLLERLVTNAIEFPPVCAIIGGILGQEVIKAISGKGDPLKNFFFFDAFDGKGIIEDLSPK
ncbi:SUMO-activating enzyme subunit 1B-1 isoform X1 [Glycine max]|uniref:SUMO-activating enzyme subunit 1B-1 isoform X1 n=1 Tax=Glycine max TaxID=3847 RepID=UPI001B35640C|nr:SUMO-activating enzyme subunit 1B-1 isoform X1 [Glycine max]